MKSAKILFLSLVSIAFADVVEFKTESELLVMQRNMQEQCRRVAQYAPCAVGSSSGNNLNNVISDSEKDAKTKLSRLVKASANSIKADYAILGVEVGRVLMDPVSGKSGYHVVTLVTHNKALYMEALNSKPPTPQPVAKAEAAVSSSSIVPSSSSLFSSSSNSVPPVAPPAAPPVVPVTPAVPVAPAVPSIPPAVPITTLPAPAPTVYIITTPPAAAPPVPTPAPVPPLPATPNKP